MRGAREYACLFDEGQYGKLRIQTGSHARGYYFHIFIGNRGNEVEVYGILGGQPGWTEWYGWKHDGPWKQDFEKLVLEAKETERLVKLHADAVEVAGKRSEEERIKNVMGAY